jgi:site-specific DNA-cytosine methylase
LSEGFIPVAHIEIDEYACDTHAAFHWLKTEKSVVKVQKISLRKAGKKESCKILPVIWIFIFTFVPKIISRYLLKILKNSRGMKRFRGQLTKKAR